MNTPQIFNTEQIVRQRDRAARSGFAQGGDFLKKLAIERLEDRLSLIKRDFPHVIDVGSHGGMVAQHLQSHPKIGTILSLDPSAVFTKQAHAFGPSEMMDVEGMPNKIAAPFDRVDGIVSLLYLHQVNDIPGLMMQMARQLKPDGLFFAILFGGRTLQELRACISAAEEELTGGIGPHIAPMADIRDIGGLMQRAGLAMPVADSELLTLTYSSIFPLMADLRAMGEGNCLIGRRTGFSRRDLFLRTAEIYQERYAMPDGRIPASFELIHVTGWSPDKSQPQPLKPGSATTPITDVF